jgi:hypothetical protein
MRFSNFLKETSKEKAADAADLLASIKDGVFTKDGSHLTVKGDFDCSGKYMTSLVGCPNKVTGTFDCYNNNLTSLVGCPKTVGGDFTCSGNKITTLVGGPKSVGGEFNCFNNKLTSLDGMPTTIGGEFDFDFNMWKPAPGCALLSLLRVKKLKSVTAYNPQLTRIINTYLPNTRGNDAIIDCQNALLDADFEIEANL